MYPFFSTPYFAFRNCRRRRARFSREAASLTRSFLLLLDVDEDEELPSLLKIAHSATVAPVPFNDSAPKA